MTKRLYLDMDGVFCDFERGVQEVSGQKVSEWIPEKELWPLLLANPDFFANLKPMAGAMELWDGVKAYMKKIGQVTPIFLTGCPENIHHRSLTEVGKEEWVRRHVLPKGGRIYRISVASDATRAKDAAVLNETLRMFIDVAGPKDIIMIFCKSDQKYIFSLPGAILLDDREKTKPMWNRYGTFLHHETAGADKDRSEKAIEKSLAYLSGSAGDKRKERRHTRKLRS
jgi:hypothetical protein